MKIDIGNFASAKYDVFSMFNNRWALCTAGSPGTEPVTFTTVISREAIAA